MTVFAHITDPHLPLAGASPRELAGKRALGWLSWKLRRGRLHRRGALEPVMADIAAAGVEHIALTGDVTNISSRAEFSRAEAWLRGVAEPRALTFVPGNHDFYVAGALLAGLERLSPWMTGVPGAARMPAFPFVRRVGAAAFIGVNSAFPAPWNEATGRVGREQLTALAEALSSAAAEGLCRVVLIHHPPLRELATKPRKALRDAEAFASVLRAAGAELVLYGHNHVWAHRSLETATGAAHLLSAPSASMAPGREKPAAGWQKITIGREGGAWTFDVERRGLAPGGAMETLERLRLSSRDARASSGSGARARRRGKG